MIDITETNRRLGEHFSGTISTLVILGSGSAGCYADGELHLLDQSSGQQTAGHPRRIGLHVYREHATLVAIGRRHLYEGASFDEVVEIVHIAASLGATLLVVTNAAGGLDPRFRRGDIMLIDGVIGSLLGRYLGASSVGRTIDDQRESERIIATALSQGVALRRGIYAGVTGPSYETRAEIGMLRKMGASAVGMSTVPEIIAARSLGMRVTGLSLITNVASDTVTMAIGHDEVLAMGHEAEWRMRAVIDAVVG